MRRTVTAHLAADVDDPALLALQIAVAGPPATEELVVTSDGKPVAVREIDGGHGGRVHALDIPSGRLVIDYIATVHGSREVPHGGESDLLEYRRPSRCCPSDKLLATAASEVGGIGDDAELVAAVRTWVHNRLSLLRARDVPARLAAVYAPGLDPMDFHAVVEAWVDGAWRLVDATGLAPRASMLRISTGRDATDTAFMTTHCGSVTLTEMEVTATVDELPNDDPAAAVELL